MEYVAIVGIVSVALAFLYAIHTGSGIKGSYKNGKHEGSLEASPPADPPPIPSTAQQETLPSNDGEPPRVAKATSRAGRRRKLPAKPRLNPPPLSQD